VVGRNFGQANNESLAGNDPGLNTSCTHHGMETKREAEKSRPQNKHLTAGRYISDNEQIIKASLSNFQHDGVAAYKVSEQSPMRPALSAKNLPGGQTEVLNVHRIKRLDGHPAQSTKDSSTASISATKITLTGMETWIIPTTAKTTWSQTMKQIWNWTTALRIQEP
jgi:hypothetical protein